MNDRGYQFPINSETKTYNFKRENYLSVYNTFPNRDWSTLDNISNVNNAVSDIYAVFYHIQDDHVPIAETFHQVYRISEIIKLIMEKIKIHERFKTSSNIFYHSEFKRLRFLVEHKINEAYARFLENIQNHFWSFVYAKMDILVKYFLRANCMMILII